MGCLLADLRRSLPATGSAHRLDRPTEARGRGIRLLDLAVARPRLPPVRDPHLRHPLADRRTQRMGLVLGRPGRPARHRALGRRCRAAALPRQIHDGARVAGARAGRTRVGLVRHRGRRPVSASGRMTAMQLPTHHGRRHRRSIRPGRRHGRRARVRRGPGARARPARGVRRRRLGRRSVVRPHRRHLRGPGACRGRAGVGRPSAPPAHRRELRRDRPVGPRPGPQGRPRPRPVPQGRRGQPRRLVHSSWPSRQRRSPPPSPTPRASGASW